MTIRRVFTIVFVAAGLVFFGLGISQIAGGRVLAANRFDLEDQLRAIAVSQRVAPAIDRARLSIIHQNDGQESVRFRIGEAPKTRVLECRWNGSKDAAASFTAYAKGDESVRQRCSVFDSSGLTIFELNGRFDPP